MIDRGKRSKTLRVVKQVENTSKDHRNIGFSTDKSHAKGSPCFT